MKFTEILKTNNTSIELYVYNVTKARYKQLKLKPHSIQLLYVSIELKQFFRLYKEQRKKQRGF